VTLRLVAEHASMWNSFGPPETYARKNAILDEWCARIGRDPVEIERTVLIEHDDLQVDAYLEAGAQHLIVELGTTVDLPFDLGPVREVLSQR
jgi:xanthine dehydrogenase molybdopterin-binding subunit B